ncbi:NADH dehydrogenase subunit C [Haloactinospora alba]|uniref:NADH-quinone oxidoreductase subunit C n=1 Tax=Haloactinospora alba TaxID=405555 RepID=A0A543NMQ7_9ACTN|nr:NADH-quinone oxidoreductase subunit C [Haloactinospora alba]TQN33110.1 NADH dehydrogenase subunit C [Haloactinospora alba]
MSPGNNGSHPDNGQNGDEENLPAQRGASRLAAPIARTDMFGGHTSGDTSGYGRLLVRRPAVPGAQRPFTDPDDPRTERFDGIADALENALAEGSVTYGEAIERVIVDRGELTFEVRREHLPTVMRRLRDDAALRFELCLGVSGVHHPEDTDRELHAVYQLRSITHNTEVRVETVCPDADPHIPSVVETYPTTDWHERETWDFFGIVFDGHPALTRIEMPDDWHGHPQRKDYPLGGIPVEYRGATIPPPEERRWYA